MLAALHRYPKAARRAVAQEWGRRSQRVQTVKRMERGPNAETLRRRAIADARGQILRAGVTFFGDGRVVPWLVRRSISGRSNQLDLFVAGRVFRTLGNRALARLLRAQPLRLIHPRPSVSIRG
jgi:thioesterase domain-containing protein